MVLWSVIVNSDSDAADTPQGVTNWRVKPEWSGRRLADEYAKGDSIRDIAARTGLSYGSVHRRLFEQDVKFRSRGGWRHGRRSES